MNYHTFMIQTLHNINPRNFDPAEFYVYNESVPINFS